MRYRKIMLYRILSILHPLAFVQEVMPYANGKSIICMEEGVDNMKFRMPKPGWAWAS